MEDGGVSVNADEGSGLPFSFLSFFNLFCLSIYSDDPGMKAKQE